MIRLDSLQAPEFDNDWLVSKVGDMYVVTALNSNIRAIGMDRVYDISEEEYRQKIEDGAYVLTPIRGDDGRTVQRELGISIGDKEILPIRLVDSEYSNWDKEIRLGMDIDTVYKNPYVDMEYNRNVVGEVAELITSTPYAYGLSKDMLGFMGRLMEMDGIEWVHMSPVIYIDKKDERTGRLTIIGTTKYITDYEYDSSDRVEVSIDTENNSNFKEVLDEIETVIRCIYGDNASGVSIIRIEKMVADSKMVFTVPVNLNIFNIKRLEPLKERGYKVDVIENINTQRELEFY